MLPEYIGFILDLLPECMRCTSESAGYPLELVPESVGYSLESYS
jgi:hypothetical protein